MFNSKTPRRPSLLRLYRPLQQFRMAQWWPRTEQPFSRILAGPAIGTYTLRPAKVRIVTLSLRIHPGKLYKSPQKQISTDSSPRRKLFRWIQILNGNKMKLSVEPYNGEPRGYHRDTAEHESSWRVIWRGYLLRRGELQKFSASLVQKIPALGSPSSRQTPTGGRRPLPWRSSLAWTLQLENRARSHIACGNRLAARDLSMGHLTGLLQSSRLPKSSRVLNYRHAGMACNLIIT